MLDLRARGKIVLGEEDDISVITDFAIYEDRTAGKNAVERYVANAVSTPTPDERTVLEAM